MKYLNIIFCCLLAQSSFGFYSTNGNKILDNKGKEIRIKSINIPFEKSGQINTLTASDYQNIIALHFNTVELSFTFPQIDKNQNMIPDAPAMKWLSEQVKLASQNQLSVIINLDEQSIELNSSSSIVYWQDIRTQSNFLRIWSFITKSYKNNPTVIGYNILPNYEKGINTKKYSFILSTANKSIRDIDTNHILFINGAELFTQNEELKLSINKNIVLLYSLFDPIEFTQQKTAWAVSKSSEKYPNYKKVSFPADLNYHSATWGDSTYFSGSRDMTNYKEVKQLINDSTIVAAIPVIEASNIGLQGEVIIQALIVTEYDANGKNIGQTTIEPGALKDITFDTEGKMSQYKIRLNYTFDQRDVFQILATEGKGVLYLNDAKFVVQQGHYYSISGYIKPYLTNLDSKVRLSLHFLKSPSGLKPVGRDKQLLINIIKKHKKTATKLDVPVMIGQCGIYNTALKTSSSAISYIKDLKEVIQTQQISFNLLSYNGDGYGLLQAELYKGKAKKTQIELLNFLKK